MLKIEESEADSQLLQAAIIGDSTALSELVTKARDSKDTHNRFTRTFLAAITEAPSSSLNVLLGTGLIDVHAEDEINKRNCLHEAAISGNEEILQKGVAEGVDVARMDVFGRLPLHYACIYGRVPMIPILLQANESTINSTDHDRFTPLIHAIVHHQLECVRQLLDHGARIEPEDEDDQRPLNLACLYDSIEIAQLLLEKGAQIRDDVEGLFPQHVVARKGVSPPALLLLQKYGASLDQQDKPYQWTPLFHAVSEGHVKCVEVLMNQGVDPDILDEKGLTSLYYAAWEGHLKCMELLISADSNFDRSRQPRANSQQEMTDEPIPERTMTDSDGIPDLSLPPPIIPLRRYGHNFLDNKTFVQLSFDAPGVDAIVFYHDSKYPAARLTVSSKLTDLIPRNLILPIQEDAKHVTFQVDNLDQFAVDFDIYPTFGSKLIARNIASPSTFAASTSSTGRCCLALLDPRMRAIGDINFRFQVIKPYGDIPLEIAQFETYWKATSQLNSYPSTLITGSSLSGEYVRLFVQLTRDCVPIVHPRFCFQYNDDVKLPIGRLDLRQLLSFNQLEEQMNSLLEEIGSSPFTSATDYYRLLLQCPLPLQSVLDKLPCHVNIDIHVLYPNASEEQDLGYGPSLNINNFVDAILKEIFGHAKILRESKANMRSMTFSSYNADICTAFNWKQPNCKSFDGSRAVENPSGTQQTTEVLPVSITNETLDY